MGQSTNGDITIVCETEQDANFVCDNLKNIAHLVQERLKYTALPHFDIQDRSVDDTVVYANVYSTRVINGDFQVDQIVEQLKVWVKEGVIKPPEFQASMMVQHQGWFLEPEEFLETN